jgi:hypothetical protein
MSLQPYLVMRRVLDARLAPSRSLKSAARHRSWAFFRDFLTSRQRQPK